MEEKSMFNIVLALDDISVKLDRIDALVNNLCSDYFAYNAEWHGKQSYNSLLGGYEQAGIFASIANDYLCQVEKDINQLAESIMIKLKEK